MPDAPTDKIAELIARIPDGHTPGPWQACATGYCAYHDEVFGRSADEYWDRSICYPGVHKMPDSMIDANMLLIALAPDLAAALRDTPALIAHIEAQGYAVVPREPTEEMVERALSAAEDADARIQKGRMPYPTRQGPNGAILMLALRAALNPEPQL